MSTDLRDRTANPTPDEGPDPTRKPKGSSLSLAQVVGGALAAMTAAALGSRLSIAGTVAGAALASVIAAVGGAIYTSSLRRTSQHVSTVLKTRRTGAQPGGVSPSTDEAVSSADTQVEPAWSTPQAQQNPDLGGSNSAVRRRIGWKPVLVGSLLMFAIAAVALTGFELLTGHALSGGTGTTIGQVAAPQTTPTPEPRRASSTSPTPSASRTASASPGATASANPSSASTADPTPTSTSSASSTPSATPTESSFGSVAPSAPAASPSS